MCHRRALFAFFALLAVAAASPARAQQSPAATEAFKSVLGKWEISNADRDRVCVLTFRPDPSGSFATPGPSQIGHQSRLPAAP